MKMNNLFLIGMLGLSTLFVSCDKSDDVDDDVNTQDQNFAAQAAISNKAEIELGTLASTKAVNASVKMFAQMMVQEHTTAHNELRDVADDVDIPLADTLDAENITLKQTLTNLTGAAFDKAYIMSQVSAHQKTLANFDAEISAGSSNRVKSYATKYRPHIKMHLDSAVAINGRVQ